MYLNVLICFACGFIGVAIHTVIKGISLEQYAKVANESFNFQTYLKTDWKAILVSFLSVFLWWLIFPEISAKYPQLIGWERSMYAVLGGFGSYICQKVLSVGKRRIDAVVDTKTNIADGIIDAQIEAAEKNS